MLKRVFVELTLFLILSMGLTLTAVCGIYNVRKSYRKQINNNKHLFR